jgi:hypothetical protein
MVLLNRGERVLLEEPTQMGDRDGKLILTDWRLIFEGRRNLGLIHSAVRGPQYVALLDSHLGQLSDVHTDKPLFGRPTLRVDQFGKSHTFKVRDAGAWAASIIQARGHAPQAGFQSPGPVVVNLHTPQAAAPQVYLHCTHCGTLNRSGGSRCGSCGAAL